MKAERQQPRISSRIFKSTFLLAAVIVTLALALLAVIFSITLEDQAKTELKAEATHIATSTPLTQIPTALEVIDPESMRATFIAADGTVVYDNRVEAAALENHLTRPEILKASESGEGYSSRFSATLDEVTQNYAIRLDDGSFLRLSKEHKSVFGAMSILVPSLIIVLIWALVSALVLARRSARQITDQVNRIDFDKPFAHNIYQELVPLAERMDKWHVDTEKHLETLAYNEQMRREFTSNVTHELKTPLTVISGYAEMIENGLAAPEDIVGFAGRIHEETDRLEDLVNDILMLSKLDESERVPFALGDFELMDLHRVAELVARRLASKAAEFEVTLAVEGETALVQGTMGLVDEMVYNLCDNAIRYNIRGGEVTLKTGYMPCSSDIESASSTITSVEMPPATTTDAQYCPYLSVRDTGVGIALENQAKVFERFFRVDSSRSKETGGTGLGLAIVKHVARYHEAQVEMESAVGQGTAIRVVFPVPSTAPEPSNP